MPAHELSAEDAAVNRIRGYFRTLDRYRMSSMRAHGRHTESVRELAAARLKAVRELAMMNADSPAVQRWYEKFGEYLEQHKLG